MAPPTLDLFGVVHVDRPGKVRAELDEFAGDADALFIEQPETEVTLHTFARVAARTPTFFLGALLHLVLLAPFYAVLNRTYDEAEAIAVRRVADDRDLSVHEVDDHPVLFMSKAGPRWVAVNWMALAFLAWSFGVAVATTAGVLTVATAISLATARLDRRLWLVVAIPVTWGVLWLTLTYELFGAGLLLAVLLFYLGSVGALNEHRNRHMLRRVAEIGREKGYDRTCLVTGKAHLAGLVSLAPDQGLSVSRMHVSRWLRTADDVIEDPDAESVRQRFGWPFTGFDTEHPAPRLGTETDVLGRRTLAACLDLVAALLVTFAGGIAFGVVAGITLGDPAIDVGLVVGFVVAPFCYYLVPEAAFGRTLGKRLLGLVVVADDGSPVSRRATLVRNLLRPLDFVPFYFLGFVVALATDRAQRIGDLVADTLVVRAE